MSDFKYGRKSYIKDVHLELPDYKFNHNPIEGNDIEGEDENSEIFIGRNKIENQLLSILKFGNSNGSYLVTGYRGMGKTSFVKRVLKHYTNYRKTEKKHKGAFVNNVKQIKISFAQADLNDKDILKQIITSLIQYASKNGFVVFRRLFSFTSMLLYSFVLLLAISFTIYLLVTIQPVKKETNSNNYLDFKEVSVSDSSFLLDLKFHANVIEKDLKKDNGKKNNKKGVSKSEDSTANKSIVKNQLKQFFLIVREHLKSDNLDTNIGGLILIAIVSLLFASGIYILKKIFEYILLKLPNIFYFQYIVEKIISEPHLFKRLIALKENIDASIVKESGFQSYGDRLPFGFLNRKVKSYGLLNSKEIETELISILEEYSKFKCYINEFIIVFDELDKVEPSLGKGFYNEKEDIRQNDKFASLQMDRTKNRREKIINILSSLKYFVTEARAKFIFIAGREMFDAALADIADRESFISSIFHQIIYVDSFLKESVSPNISGGNTLSAMAELYLSHILLPIEYNSKSNFLRDYYHYINSNYNEFNYKNISASEYQEELLKIIYTLQTFIVFLTYRSNGSPKKLVRIIEEYIIDDNSSKIHDSAKHNILIRRNNKKLKLYLSLTYKNQYHFGFITYIYRPFLMGQSIVLKDFSDNILVSTPYLMDHILKYHPFAFSKQNLELIPEVFTNNRNPLFRYFIDELVKYLNINHLRETELGIFDYKFLSKTTNEISYLSKIFEEELAAFNFSLDEMFYVKHHIKEKIIEIRSNYGIQQQSNHEFIRSICFLNGILGDSYYFDQEYDNAIVAYSDGIQYLMLSQSPSLDHSINHILLKLKLGLVHERMGNFENALGFYADCMNELEIITKKDSWYFEKRNQEILKLYNLSYSAYLCITEKYSFTGINYGIIETYSKKIEKNFDSNVNKQEQNLVLADFYNNIGSLLFYKNYSILVFSITRKKGELIKALNESDWFKELLRKNEKEKKHFTLEKDKYSEGRFNYYVEGNLIQIPTQINLDEDWVFDFNSDIEDKSKLISLEDKDEQFSSISLENYRKGLFYCIQSINHEKKFFTYLQEDIQTKKLISIASNLLFDRRTNLSKNTLKTLGYSISAIGDSILSGIKEENGTKFKNIADFLKNSFDAKYKDDSKKKKWDKLTDEYFRKKYKNNIEEEELLTFIVFVYYLAGRFFSKAGLLTSFGIQLKKILQILNRFSKDNEGFNYLDEDFLKIIEETILALILEVASWNSDSTDRPQIYKYKNIISSIEGLPHPQEFARNNYTNISNNPDVKEALLLFAKLKLRVKDYKIIKGNSLDEIIANIPEACLISPYHNVASQMTRMLELDVMSIINGQILEGYFPELIEWINQPYKFYKRYSIEVLNIKNYPNIYLHKEKEEKYFYEFVIGKILCPEFQKKKNDFKNLVINSIFTLLELVQIIEIYTINPYLSNSFCAASHHKLGNWLKYYELSRLIDGMDGMEKNDEEETKVIIESMNGKGTMITHDSTSHYQIALKYYHRAKEFHKNGKEYHTYLASSLIFLEGSYDDELYHFGIALERQSLNDGSIRKQIRELEAEIKSSPLLKYDSYVNNVPI